MGHSREEAMLYRWRREASFPQFGIATSHLQGKTMASTAAATAHSIDSILSQLQRFRQRATYGAVAGVLSRAARNLMEGRSRETSDSWIVSAKDGKPTGYAPEQMDPELESRERILRTTSELEAWLENPS
jgi:hypothetical protein